MPLTRKITLFLAFIPTIMLIISIFLIGSCNVREIQYESKFSQIDIGQSQQKVINSMGNASQIKKCSESEYDGKNCLEIYGYFTFFKYWAVAFDKDGNVIKKFRWSLDDGYGKPKEFDFPISIW